MTFPEVDYRFTDLERHVIERAVREMPNWCTLTGFEADARAAVLERIGWRA